MDGATISPKEMRKFQETINRSLSVARRVEGGVKDEVEDNDEPADSVPASDLNAQTQAQAAQQLRQKQQQAALMMMMDEEQKQQQQQEEQSVQSSRPKVDPKTKRNAKMVNIFQILEKAGSQTYALGGDMDFNETVISLARLAVTHMKGLASFSLFKKIPGFDLSNPSDKLNYYITILGLAFILTSLLALVFLVLIITAVAFTYYDRLASIPLLGEVIVEFIVGLIF
ncbi:MAG: hypothetical protein V1695_00180 [Candidatus Uhrbacteria bacterium]